MNISRRNFLRRAAVAVPIAVAVPAALSSINIEAEPEEDKTYAFARVDDPQSMIWCIKREDGRTFWVINGHWVYDPAGPPAASTLVWQGVAPFEERDYNAAINWIRDQIAA